ncbi:MAG: DUF2793 domain-containing protein, partial [Alphaproteobacteria bacterium]|nr:DUF2793 domain-containing protein [Alphaproteobacteria bacterium]
MATTSNLNLTLVDQSQAQKEVTVNAALSRIDAILNTGAKDKDLTTPPGSPAEGDVYIVDASAAGAWSGKDGQVAYYNSGWKFIVPKEGLTLWVSDEDAFYVYDGASWQLQSSGGGGGLGKTALFIPAKEWEHSNVTDPAGSVSVTVFSAGNAVAPRRAFAASVRSNVQYLWKLPKSWDRGTVTYKVYFFTQSTSTNTVRWGVQGVAISHDDTADASFGTAVEGEWDAVFQAIRACHEAL